jgi:hypothetical protein
MGQRFARQICTTSAARRTTTTRSRTTSRRSAASATSPPPFQALANTALKLAEYAKATDHDDDRSVLTELRQAVIEARTSAVP